MKQDFFITWERGVEFSNSERLIVLMLASIHKKLGIDDFDPDFLMDSIYEEQTWAIDWKMPGILGDRKDPTPPQVYVVADVLEMWEALEDSYNGLNDDEKAELARVAAPFGKDVVFRGFDGNNETEAMAITRTLVDRLDRFSTFAGRDFNSHAPSMWGYQRMHEVFKKFDPTDWRTLSVEQLAEVLNAKRYEP